VLFREDPPPTPEFQIRVGPEFNGTWLYPSTRSDLGNPPTEFCDTNEYWSWLRASKAVPAANSFAVILGSNTESTVIVEGMSVQVRDRRPPLAGILLECAIGGWGAGPVGSATIDLDRPTPSIAYETPTGEPIKRLAFKLEKGVDQFLIIDAKSRRNHVSWDASLLLLVDGVRRPVLLQDPDTQGPFSTTPSEVAQRPGPGEAAAGLAATRERPPELTPSWAGCGDSNPTNPSRPAAPVLVRPTCILTTVSRPHDGPFPLPDAGWSD